MEKRRPVFLTRLFRRSPQNSEFTEAKGWGDTADDTRFNGWGSSPGSSSGAITNGWTDEPPENDYNGWGSVSLPRPRTPEATSNGWVHEKPKDEYNGWGSGSGSGSERVEASSNGWMTDEPLNDGYKGWSSAGKCTTLKAKISGWMDELPEGNSNGWDIPQPKPVSKQAEIDVGSIPIAESRPVKVESWAPSPVPSAPPLPDGGFDEDPAANVSDPLYYEGKNGDTTCAVCWEAPVEGACVPCGHMASCMTCLHEIESKQGTCPVCRAKIDRVMRIYAI